MWSIGNRYWWKLITIMQKNSFRASLIWIDEHTPFSGFVLISDSFHQFIYVATFNKTVIVRKIFCLIFLAIAVENSDKTNENASERLMLLDYEFHTVLKCKTITHIPFISRSNQKTCSLKQTSGILIWINEDLMPITAFSTSFRKLKKRLHVFKDEELVVSPSILIFFLVRKKNGKIF